MTTTVEAKAAVLQDANRARGLLGCPQEIYMNIFKYFDDIRPVAMLASTCTHLHRLVDMTQPYNTLISSVLGPQWDGWICDALPVGKDRHITKQAKYLSQVNARMCETPILRVLEDDPEDDKKDGRLMTQVINKIPAKYGKRVALFTDSNPDAEAGRLSDSYQRLGKICQGFTEYLYDPDQPPVMMLYTLNIVDKKIKFETVQQPQQQQQQQQGEYTEHDRIKRTAPKYDGSIPMRGDTKATSHMVDLFSMANPFSHRRIAVFTAKLKTTMRRPYVVFTLDEETKVVRKLLFQDRLNDPRGPCRVCCFDDYILLLCDGDDEWTIEVYDLAQRYIAECPLPPNCRNTNLCVTAMHAWAMDDHNNLYCAYKRNVVQGDPQWCMVLMADSLTTKGLKLKVTERRFYDKYISFSSRGQLLLFNILTGDPLMYSMYYHRWSRPNNVMSDHIYHDEGQGKWLVDDMGRAVMLDREHLQNLCDGYILSVGSGFGIQYTSLDECVKNREQLQQQHHQQQQTATAEDQTANAVRGFEDLHDRGWLEQGTNRPIVNKRTVKHLYDHADELIQWYEDGEIDRVMEFLGTGRADIAHSTMETTKVLKAFPSWQAICDMGVFKFSEEV